MKTTKSALRNLGYVETPSGWIKPSKTPFAEPSLPVATFLPPQPPELPPQRASSPTVIVIRNVRGGKNSMQIAPNGMHYPKPEWAEWRDIEVESVRKQLGDSWITINDAIIVRLDYYAGDRRRRDMPAIIDACWHVLEKAGFVSDDHLLWIGQSTRSYCKENPRAEITIIP